MTEQEAIEYFKTGIKERKKNNMALVTISALELAISALEKRIPKRALIHNYRCDYDLTCNGCGKTYEYLRYSADRYNYCPHCGQSIKWE